MAVRRPAAILAALLALFLAQQTQGPQPTPQRQQQQQRQQVITQPRTSRPGEPAQPPTGATTQPGVAERTGRMSAPASGVGQSAGRAGTPGCAQVEPRTGRGGGEVCRPAGTLPPVGVPEPTPPQPPRTEPERPTGLQPGDYPKTFPPYGTQTGGPPPPYGPGLGGRTVGP